SSIFLSFSSFFFSTAPSTTDIYTLSLHDALPILPGAHEVRLGVGEVHALGGAVGRDLLFDLGDDQPLAGRPALVQAVIAVSVELDRKSTRLNSSHDQISYAVFCLKKKKKYNKMYY